MGHIKRVVHQQLQFQKRQFWYNFRYSQQLSGASNQRQISLFIYIFPVLLSTRCNKSRQKSRVKTKAHLLCLPKQECFSTDILLPFKTLVLEQQFHFVLAHHKMYGATKKEAQIAKLHELFSFQTICQFFVQGRLFRLFICDFFDSINLNLIFSTFILFHQSVHSFFKVVLLHNLANFALVENRICVQYSRCVFFRVCILIENY